VDALDGHPVGVELGLELYTSIATPAIASERYCCRLIGSASAPMSAGSIEKTHVRSRQSTVAIVAHVADMRLVSHSSSTLKHTLKTR